MRDPTRTWLRRIALGLPLASAPFSGLVLSSATACIYSCPDPTVRTFSISEAEAAFLADPDASAPDGGSGFRDCHRLCADLDRRATGRPLPDGGRLVAAEGSATTCRVLPDGAAVVECTWAVYCGSGRRPQGLVDSPDRAHGIGAWLAQMAWLERASVPAFEDLAHDLARFAAPAHLIRAALRAADDERAHARTMEALARARGCEPPPVIRRELRAHATLEELACDNAAEGGVRETFGALLAATQAEHAEDADVRDAMRTIARDEARHALLSAAIEDWVRPKVDARAVAAARSNAAHALARALMIDPLHLEDARALGLPHRAARARLAASLA